MPKRWEEGDAQWRGGGEGLGEAKPKCRAHVMCLQLHVLVAGGDAKALTRSRALVCRKRGGAQGEPPLSIGEAFLGPLFLRSLLGVPLLQVSPGITPQRFECPVFGL